jgi:hypothetical protein
VSQLLLPVPRALIELLKGGAEQANGGLIMGDSVATPDPGAASTRITRVDAERKHLEGLFKDRLNFQLVFASLFMVGLGKIDAPRVRVEALITITVVSFLMAFALLRTFLLVRQALAEIKKADKHHPYTDYAQHTWKIPNANSILISIPFLLFAFFAILTVSYAMKLHHDPKGVQDQSSSCTTFQVEDRSDRHTTNETEPAKPPATGVTKGAAKNAKQNNH